MKRRSLSSKVIYSLALAAVVYLGMSLWAGWSELTRAASQFRWAWLPAVLMLSVINYLLRFGKWQYYLRLLGLKIPRRESLMIHLSGLALTITPGKLGEVVKSYFLWRRYQYPVARTAPIVLADRLSDLIAALLLAAVGSLGFHYGHRLVVITTGILILIIVLISIRPIGRRLFGWSRFYQASYELIRFDRLIWPTVLATAGWGGEALGFWFIWLGLGLTGSFLSALFVYSFATIVGAIALLPGGLGVTEGTLVGLLRYLAIPEGIAALATLLVRAATLWFGVILGTVMMIVTERRFGLTINQLSDTNNE